MFGLETHYILDNFLRTYNKLAHLETVLIDVQSIKPIRLINKNLHTLRAIYYMDSKRYKMGINYFWKKKDLNQIYKYSLTHIEHLIGIGSLGLFLEHQFNTMEPLDPFIISQKGFYAMDQELERESDTHLQKLRNIFTKNVAENGWNLPPSNSLVLTPQRMEQITPPRHISFYHFGSARFQLEHQFDVGHLNYEGAILNSTMLAEKFKEVHLKIPKK